MQPARMWRCGRHSYPHPTSVNSANHCAAMFAFFISFSSLYSCPTLRNCPKYFSTSYSLLFLSGLYLRLPQIYLIYRVYSCVWPFSRNAVIKELYLYALVCSSLWTACLLKVPRQSVAVHYVIVGIQSSLVELAK